MSSVWGSVVAQLGAARPDPKPDRVGGFNPRPRGLICAGSATEAVLAYLRRPEVRDSRRWLVRADIVSAVGRSEKAVDWALCFLVQAGLVEAEPDYHRRGDGRYRRFRARA